MKAAETEARAPENGIAAHVFDVALLLLIAVIFSPAALGLVRAWLSIDYLSYGLVIAPFCAYLAWSKRPSLAKQPSRRDARGGLALMLAFGLFLVGFFANVLFLQGLALVAALASAVWLLRGPAWLRELAFPLAYLLFVVPLPDAALFKLTTGLRLLASESAVAILHAFALPIMREGNLISLPEGTLFVADACSGISSIVALLPAAVILAYFNQPGWLGKLVLVATAVPIAMLWNLVRVLGTVVGALRFGTEAATSGALHESAGLITFTLGCLSLLAVDWTLRRWHRRPAAPRTSRAIETG